MKHLKLILLAIICIILCPSFASAQVVKIDDSKDPSALKVLFIGNSFTFVNSLPNIFSTLVKTDGSGRQLKIYMSAYPDYTLTQHLNNAYTMNALQNEGPWDYIVLQERSFFPLSHQAEMEKACAEMDKKIKAVKARTVLMMTWSDHGQDQAQDTISHEYKKVAWQINALLVPVGDVWWKAMSSNNSLALYGDDGHHPSVTGAYLSACTFYAALARKDPRKLPDIVNTVLKIPTSTADQLKQYAAYGAYTNSSRPSNYSPDHSNTVRTYHWK